MEAKQYRSFRRGEVQVIFHCKACTEKTGAEYNGHVHIFESISANVSIDTYNIEDHSLNSLEERQVMEDIVPLLTPRPLVDYPSSSEDSYVSVFVLV